MIGLNNSFLYFDNNSQVAFVSQSRNKTAKSSSKTIRKYITSEEFRKRFCKREEKKGRKLCICTVHNFDY